MCGFQSSDELLNKAYKLAHFICGDKPSAIKIATAAMSKQQVAAAAQDKRLYYRPGGRSLLDKMKPSRFRTKVSLNESHVLQRLVYIESEPYERLREQSEGPQAVSQECMTIHFIKHLVRITIKRNSFYVALGLSRLLHNYSTSETMEIYNVVVQDPDRVKDDYYYRSRKGRLMQEMKDRFGGLLKTLSSHRGEVRFQAEDDSSVYAGLAKECLNFFCPWDTLCLLAEGFDPVSDAITQLSFKGNDPDNEHEIEVNRMHSVLHPECYRRLIEGLRLDHTDLRLEVPRFNMSTNTGNEDRPGPDRRDPPNLDEADLRAIRDILAEEASSRKRASAGLMRVLVDGAERARWDAAGESSVSFSVEEGNELIEVRREREGGEILLASHLLSLDEAGRRIKSSAASLILEGGQKFSFLVSPSGLNTGEINSAVVVIKYEETNAFRAAMLFMRRARASLSRLPRDGSPSGPGALKPVAALIVLLLVAAAALYFSKAGPRTDVAQGEAKQENESKEPPAQPPPVGTKPQEVATQANVNADIARKPALMRPARGQARKRLSSGPLKDILAQKDRGDGPPEPVDADSDATRGLSRNSGSVSLPAVKKIRIELPGDGPANRSVRDALVERLRSTSRFSMTENMEEPDAVIKLTVERGPDDAGSAAIRVRLVNTAGDVIWPLEKKDQFRRYEGPLKAIADRFVSDLLTDAARPESKR
jgi:hypothetical protein